VEQGKVSLDDPLLTYIDDFPDTGVNVTVRHLLNHTSGIPSYTGKEAFWEKSRLDLSHEQLLALVKDDDLEFEPGTGYKYNNSGYYLLGMVLEKATGKDYGDYLAETIFEPLGLEATSYCHNAPIIPHRADGYDLEDGELVNAAPLSMGPPFPAGALCSSVVDLMRWQRALVDGKVVSPESYQLMTTRTRLADGSEQNYGFGLGVGEIEGEGRIAHGGGINGFSTFLSYYPEHDLSIAVLTNSGQGDPGRIEHRLFRKVMGLPDPDYTVVDVATEVLERYVGVYEMPAFSITVTRDGDQLSAQPTGQDTREIYPTSETEFFLEDIDVRLSFQVDDDGVVQGLTVHEVGRDTSGKKVE
jgi:CubicO group peptidase (beta-lactamase class C family)